ncbi:hypothetical protein GW17_00045910 [Ensete ventricosum]|nr:hypothetical protein GW17_00045910 [Ensete ventricosum]
MALGFLLLLLFFFLLFFFFFFFLFSPSIDHRRLKSTIDGRFLPQSTADGRNRSLTVDFWRYRLVAGGLRIGNLADRGTRRRLVFHWENEATPRLLAWERGVASLSRKVRRCLVCF